MKRHSNLKRITCILALAMPLHAYSASVITELTWNDATNGTVTSTGGDAGTNADIDISYASTLVSFRAGGVLYNNFTTVNSTTASGNTNQTPYWGLDAIDLTAADDQLSVTDNRLDTGMVNLGNDSDFFFPSSPTSLSHLLFIFDGGSADSSRDLELIDGSGNVVGSATTVNFSVTRVADFDFQRVGDPEELNVPFVGLAIPLSDFGLAAGDLSSVTGVRIDGGTRLDPTLIGIAVPEPSSVALLGLGGLALIMRRRR